jgi:hypothetical protein
MAADQPARCKRPLVRTSGVNPLVLNFLALAAIHCTLNAQQPAENIIAQLNSLVVESYGPDQHLINGIEYVNLHLHSSGHKFLDEDKFYVGRLVIDKKVYRDIFLKYDIYNQQVLLLIGSLSGGHKQIIVNTLRIDEFEINGRIFRKYTFPGIGTRFYQYIGNDEMACLYHFKKEEIFRPIDRYTFSEFTDMKKKSYIYWKSELHEFKGTHSFARTFPDHQPEIKAFIRQNKLKIRKLNDQQMYRLISYCQSITETHAKD